MEDVEAKAKAAIAEGEKVLKQIKGEIDAVDECLKKQEELFLKEGVSKEYYDNPPKSVPDFDLSDEGQKYYQRLIKELSAGFNALMGGATKKEKKASKRASKVGSKLSRKGLRI